MSLSPLFHPGVINEGKGFFILVLCFKGWGALRMDLTLSLKSLLRMRLPYS
jgi:hypothetical protein